MSSPSFSILFIGITGYIGGAVGLALKAKYPSAEFVAFVRSTKLVPEIESLGFKTLVGSGVGEHDRSIIANAALTADIVVNTADADDLELTNAILGAVQNSTKHLPILIHTSGTGMLLEGNSGELIEGAKLWDDSKPEDIKAINIKQPHRQIDLAILDSAKNNKFISYIIAPSIIYGVAHGNPGNKITVIQPAMIRLAIQRRQAVYGGKGTNRWNVVHITDLANLYLLVCEKALSERSTGHIPPDPFERFYFGAVDSASFHDFARLIAPLLYERKLVDSPEAVSVPTGEVPSYFNANSNAVSNRGFRDGWKPIAPPYESCISEEVDATVKGLGL
ncbi:hypothetical protein BS47DRAFT_1345371 [Hydnum rufescens UP504]|uniref:NAD(P)-binding protein n=1 Tax=Hydnum rufescens UP504 TaxID=1448309 RepID=A0A9P6AW19_9AGAM|nr:hypothetical protein BS47DRAFT_1345371 [Hydnum rufescens UP504]